MTSTNIAPLKPEQVHRDAWTENMGADEYVAVDGTGRVIAKADKATIEKDYPNYSIFGAKDFPKGKAGDAPIDNIVHNAPPPGVPVTPSGLPVSDALADDPNPEPGTRTHPLDDGTPYEGPQTVDPTNAALNTIAAQSGTPIKDALAASSAKAQEAEQAGNHAKTDELQQAQVKALEKDGVLDKDNPKRVVDGTNASQAKTSKKDPLDHDEDGKKGGHKLNADKVAADKKAKLAKNV